MPADADTGGLQMYFAELMLMNLSMGFIGNIKGLNEIFVYHFVGPTQFFQHLSNLFQSFFFNHSAFSFKKLDASHYDDFQ